jgi:hypothetical protein
MLHDEPKDGSARMATCDRCGETWLDTDHAYHTAVETDRDEWCCGDCVEELVDDYFARVWGKGQ